METFPLADDHVRQDELGDFRPITQSGPSSADLFGGPETPIPWNQDAPLQTPVAAMMLSPSREVGSGQVVEETVPSSGPDGLFEEAEAEAEAEAKEEAEVEG